MVAEFGVEASTLKVKCSWKKDCFWQNVHFKVSLGT